MNDVTGLSELLSKFAVLGAEGSRMANAVLNVTADQIVAQAKQNAPTAFGKIRQGIVKSQVADLRVMVASTASESAFQEFGTGGRVDVPEEMTDIAAQFKGASGGGMQAFIISLIDWIKLRGLTNTYSVATRKVATKGTADQTTQLAWAIAKKILRDGLQPQPFLYPAYLSGTSQLVPKLQTALQELLKRKQG